MGEMCWLHRDRPSLSFYLLLENNWHMLKIEWKYWATAHCTQPGTTWARVICDVQLSSNVYAVWWNSWNETGDWYGHKESEHVHLILLQTANSHLKTASIWSRIPLEESSRRVQRVSTVLVCCFSSNSRVWQRNIFSSSALELRCFLFGFLPLGRQRRRPLTQRHMQSCYSTWFRDHFRKIQSARLS